MIMKWGGRVMDYFFNPCPTLFDLCVCFGILGIGFIRPVLRGFYLEFYAIFLVVIGFHFKEKRHFNGASLTILCLIGLMSLFFHSYYAAPKNPSFQYLNFYLMHEGFGYIFFACLLFHVVATKATNLRLLLFAIPIVIKKAWIPIMLHTGSMTPLLAIFVGFIVWLLFKKRFLIVGIITLIGLGIVLRNYTWLIMKFGCRPHIWMDLLRYMKHIPNTGSNIYAEVFRSSFLSMLVGSGFNKLLVADNMLLVSTWGPHWLFRHNDFLSLMAYIGIFSIVPVFLFVKELFVRFRRTWFVAPLIAFCALCFFQITFIRPDRVGVILLSLAWMYVES